jgi:hypothetical protein
LAGKVEARANLDCGGKRSATLLWKRSPIHSPCESAVAAALCQRSPKAAANAAQILWRQLILKNPF